MASYNALPRRPASPATFRRPRTPNQRGGVLALITPRQHGFPTSRPRATRATLGPRLRRHGRCFSTALRHSDLYHMIQRRPTNSAQAGQHFNQYTFDDIKDGDCRIRITLATSVKQGPGGAHADSAAQGTLGRGWAAARPTGGRIELKGRPWPGRITAGKPPHEQNSTGPASNRGLSPPKASGSSARTPRTSLMANR